jgi:2-dehydro-3-deoxyphosphogalactonate aldolase
LESIGRLATSLGDRAIIGAGTVLDPADVGRVRDAGGRLIVAPNTSRDVIEATVRAGMVSAPGYFTPSEGFEALRAGAHALKLFPAEAASPGVVKAQRAVLPKDVPLLVVGGVTPGNMRPYMDAGANGFGLGSGLYKPGQSPEQVRAQADAYIAGLER